MGTIETLSEHHLSVVDIEKQAIEKQAQPCEDCIEDSTSSRDNFQTRSGTKQLGWKSRFAKWNDNIEGLDGLEARGITRVPDEEKHSRSKTVGYGQMFLLWFGITMSVNMMVVGFLGPLIFSLGWSDSVWIVIVGNALACAGTAYVSTFGALSGLRTMVLGRFFMGYWPAKLACLLNVIMQTGWGIIGCIVSGQLLSAVNGGHLSIAVGCVITAVGMGILTIFGVRILHLYERYAAWPQAFAFLIFIGSSGQDWDTSLASVGDARSITANRCSFFTVIFATIVGFSAVSADLYVYYPKDMDRRLTFLATWSGLFTAGIFTQLLGVGIATGVATSPALNAAYQISSGALIKAGFEGLDWFGGFCVVLLAIGCIQNNAPAIYVAALSIQTFGRYAKAVPRWIWCLLLMVVQLVCSVAGRNNLYTFFENFLPIMAYWVCPWLTIIIEEHLIFRSEFDWSAWDNPKKLPVGIAAMFAWLVGWAGAIIGMAQVWYAGPVALAIGGEGGDVGAWLAVGFAGLVYPPLRWLELRKFGR